MESMDTREWPEKAKCNQQYVISFVTKESRFAVPSTPFSINGSTLGLELNSLIKTLINESNDNENELNLVDIEFDFLINSKLLRSSVGEFVESERLNPENQVVIEFILKSSPPKPHNSLLHDDWVSCVDSKDNWVISGCYDSSVHIWDLKAEGSHKITIPAHLAPVKAIKWISGHSGDDSDHMFVSSSHDETAVVWKWNSNTNQVEYLFSCRGHSRSVDCLDVNNDLIASGSYDQMLKVWSIVDQTKDTEESEGTTSKQKKLKKNDGSQSIDKKRTPIITMSGHKEAITGCVWIKNSDSLQTGIADVGTCSMDNTIRLWDIEVGQNKQTLTGNKAFLSVSYSSFNHCLLTGSCDRHIRLWDPRTDSGSFVKQVYSSHQSWVSSIDWSEVNENQFVSGSYDSVVKQWDIRSSNVPLYDLIGHEDKVLCVNWSSDKYIISGSVDNHLKIFSNFDKKQQK